jgi:hypothetical protein
LGKIAGSSKVTHIVLPRNVVKRNRVDVLVEDERERDGEVEDVEALGTNGERQDLDGVRDDERSKRKAVEKDRSASPNKYQ